ncbi:MAG: hypothetical protein SGI92_09290 [Bryobacteraceae bacterium]|nr:hypothetical protein [Bryobacteraceae bacterium]
MEMRLGDIIDDHCIKCRRLTNHSVVSLVESQVAKVRCRSCYHEHTYLHEQAPPTRKELKKAELAAKAEAEAAAGGAVELDEPVDEAADDVEPGEVSDPAAEDVAETVPSTKSETKTRSTKT